jgi:hypothetical protein
MFEKTNKFYIETLLIVILIVLVVSIMILSCVPPVSKDALVHHLAVPKLYLKHGGMYEIPFMPFSYYPMNVDLLYLIPLYFGNDILPKFIHFSFALLTVWLIFKYLKRRINTIYALLGIIFFLSIPIIVKLSTTVYVDLGLIFFSTASLLLLLKWIEKGFHLKTLILSASFCGLAMGTKYNGLVTFFLLTLFVPFLYSRYMQSNKPRFLTAAGYGALFLCVALIFFSPWMIRNYIWTNNPIFPLYDHWFNPQNAVNEQVAGIFTFRSLVYQETWWQILLLPVRVFFQGQDGSHQYFDGTLNPFLLFLPFFAFYHIRKDPQFLRNEKKILLAFACLFFISTFFTSGMRVRYISPMLPPLVLLSIFGIRKMAETVSGLATQYLRRIGFSIFFLIILFTLWLNTYYIVNQYKYVTPFSYLGSTLSREQYINKYRPEYPAMQYINKNLPGDAKILFIYLGNRAYYCDREYVFDMIDNRSTFRQIVKESSDPEKIFLSLKSIGINHLLIRYDVFDEWVKTDFTPQDRKVMKVFFKKYVKLLFFKWGYGLSQLGYFS